MEKQVKIQSVRPGRRRRFTAQQKRALLDEAALPGKSISETARTYGIYPSQMFQWRRAMDDATEESLKSNERLVPESELKKAQARIKELERVLGRKTMDVEILEEAVRIGREKKLISRAPLRKRSGGK
jgi:transposase